MRLKLIKAASTTTKQDKNSRTRKMFKQLTHAKKIWDYGLGRTTLAAFCAHSVSISIGICQGYSAILLPQLYKSAEYDLDQEEMSWIASLGVVTNPIGSILSGLFADYFGRKISMQLSTIPFIVGWLLIAFASDINYLYAGRLITGIAAGMSAACYTYVSEISQPAHRGIFQALGPVSASFGILFTYLMGYYFPWQRLALFALIFSSLTVISIVFMPESPAHLMRVKRNSDAFDSLLWLRRSNAQALQEYQNLKMQQEETAQDGQRPKNCLHLGNYCRASTMKPFCILVVLFFLQEMSGIYTILFYAVNFFQEANLNVDENVSSIIVGVIRFAMSIIAAFLISRYSLKALCMVSSGGMALSLGAILLTTQFSGMNTLQLVCILLNVLFSMTGMLPIPWILVGELFPLSVRSIMSGIVICIAQCFIFLSVKIYPDMIACLSFVGTVGVFGIASLLALIFTKCFLPETRNRSLEEIEKYFSNKDAGDDKKSRFRILGRNKCSFDLEKVAPKETKCPCCDSLSSNFLEEALNVSVSNISETTHSHRTCTCTCSLGVDNNAFVQDVPVPGRVYTIHLSTQNVDNKDNKRTNL